MKRFLEHCFIFCFLFLTGAAFFFTMTKIQLPFVPWPVLRFVYGMMAPYQGYSIFNADLLAEGKLLRNQESGIRNQEQWKVIDLHPYYPMIRGDQIMYHRLRSFHALGEEIQKEKYTELATLLLAREHEHGKNYEAVRLTWQEWPASTKGFEAMRKEPFIVDYFITQVP